MLTEGNKAFEHSMSKSYCETALNDDDNGDDDDGDNAGGQSW